MSLPFLVALELDANTALKTIFKDLPEKSTSSAAHSQSTSSGEISNHRLKSSSNGHVRSTSRRGSRYQDTTVDIILSGQPNILGEPSPLPSVEGTEHHLKASMTISPWMLEGEQYFTCSFLSLQTTPTLQSGSVPRGTDDRASQLMMSSSSGSSSLSGNEASRRLSPSNPVPSPMPPLPHLTAPSESSLPMQPLVPIEPARLRDAMIDAIPTLAICRDQTIAVPNNAVIHLMRNPTGPMTYSYNELLSRFDIYSEDFSRRLTSEEYPIARLCNERTPFKNWKIGLKLANGELKSFDVSGDSVYDGKTDDFQGGLLAFRDVTEYRNIIKAQNEQNEQQFQLVCDTLPQLLWTADPMGRHDWFSRRWYEYTGLNSEDCLGEGWQHSFHSDDLLVAKEKWEHSLKTGDEYCVEYRCRRYDGQWRFMLGLAVPLRDKRTGKIQKWFGSCEYT